MSILNFMLNWVEHGISFITSGPGYSWKEIHIQQDFSLTVSIAIARQHLAQWSMQYHKIYRKNSKIWDTSNNCHNCPKNRKVWCNIAFMHPKDAYGMANSVDPDQTASSEAVWSWSALFAETYLSQYIEFVRYSRTSVAWILVACFLRLLRTCSWVRRKKFHSCRFGII